MRTRNKNSTIRLHPQDNVIVTRFDLHAGAEIHDERITCLTDVPEGHKIAAAPIKSGMPVYKYSQIIGFASRDIAPGEHVHTHNMTLKTVARDYAFTSNTRPTDFVPQSKQSTFDGIIRPNGRVGTRNYIGVLPTCNCSASVARYIADSITASDLEGFANVDGVVAFSHGSGCGLGGVGEGFAHLQRVMEGFMQHPNFGGILMVGLGCEEYAIDILNERVDLKAFPNLQTLVIQQSGGTPGTVKAGAALIREMLGEANRVKRKPVPASHIILGLECGGSDAYSGITANPALGAAVDCLVQHGGTAILSETPEIYGAEHLLTRRAKNPETGQKIVDLIHWWEDYTNRHGSQMDNNPSPGNKAGGVTTIFEKSLGAVAKGGTTNLNAVYRYAEPVSAKGLVFMDTPGYDPVSVTGMVAGGANLICFTTGRGSVFGCKPAPVIKLATRTALFESMRADMDVNCGLIADGESDIEQIGKEIFDLIIATASGKKTKSEMFGFGDNEFVPWHIGAVI
jgi:altronate hydrolase